MTVRVCSKMRSRLDLESDLQAGDGDPVLQAGCAGETNGIG